MSSLGSDQGPPPKKRPISEVEPEPQGRLITQILELEAAREEAQKQQRVVESLPRNVCRPSPKPRVGPEFQAELPPLPAQPKLPAQRSVPAVPQPHRGSSR